MKEKLHSPRVLLPPQVTTEEEAAAALQEAVALRDKTVLIE